MQFFALRPGPDRLDALFVVPLAMAGFAMYEAPLAPLKATMGGMNAVSTPDISTSGVPWCSLLHALDQHLH
jgi:hypothetical protein